MRPLPISLLPTVAALIVLTPTLATAQDTPLDPTPEQRQLAQAALDAFQAEHYDETIDLYRRSLAIQPLNITYITLGYAYFSAGRCEEAVWAYDNADRARPVKTPGPEQLKRLLLDYRAELPDRCARIALECESPDIQVALDTERKAAPCTNQILWLSPGEHTLHVTPPGANTRTEPLNVRATESRFLPIKIKPPTNPAPTDNTPPTEPPSDPPPSASTEPPPPFRLLGWIVGGTGLAALTTVAILDFTLFQPGLDDLQAAADSDDAARHDQLRVTLGQQQTFGRILGVSGALLLAGGVTLYLLGADAETPPTAPTQGIGLHWGSDALGLDWLVTW